MKRSFLLGAFPWILAACLSLALCLPPEAAAQADARNPAWAVPLEVEGLPNLHKVSDHLYRSGHPDATGLRHAQEMGITTVLSLRSSSGDEEAAEGTSLLLIRVPMRAWNPRYEDVVYALRQLRPDVTANRGPVLVHCLHGADRTGLIVAVYRILYQGWTREAAIEEMLDGDYGYHSIWRDIIKFVRNVDLRGLKKDVYGNGLPL